MPTSFTDQFLSVDPFAPPPVGTSISVSSLGIVDQNDNGFIGQGQGDTINGSLVTASYAGDTVTINVSGVGLITYSGCTFYLENGQRVFTPTDGQVLQSGTFVSGTGVSGDAPVNVDDLTPLCFTAGTLIKTPSGLRQVELFKVGDLVETMDNGPQAIRWIDKQTIGSAALMAQPNLRPIRIQAGSLGSDLPVRDLLVSPQHRMLASNRMTERMFNAQEVLVAAKQLVAMNGIDVADDVEEVTYVHFLCDQHELVFAEGAVSETLHTGAEAMKSVSEVARQEIFSIFPELRDRDPDNMPTEGARIFVKGRMGHHMAQRLVKNNKSLLERA